MIASQTPRLFRCGLCLRETDNALQSPTSAYEWTELLDHEHGKADYWEIDHGGDA